MAENSNINETSDFIRDIIREDLDAGKHSTTVTRFPPEPNGYLHLGHAKSICLNFGIAEENASTGSRCHLRFDDTNPTKEETEYVDSIQEDIKWLGFDWGDYLYFASDNFEQLYEWAVFLINQGKAYVDELTADQIREYRGTLTEPGKDSPFRDRPAEESLEIFSKMRSGQFKNGEKVLRAKIDMADPNINLRDPVIYRILHAEHHRTGTDWCIYPSYDFAHGQCDAIEAITHSLCTLEFEQHRPLYDWFIDNLPVSHKPRQIEFSKLQPTFTLMSKRRLIQMVEEGHVDAWDDPRMSTISGMRRRGYPPEALRSFCKTVGVTKFTGITDIALLEHAIREQLNREALRKMVVLDPIKVSITNWPGEDHTEQMNAINNPGDDSLGARTIPLSSNVYIERDDFMQDPPKKFYRLSPGSEVRLRYSYCITCDEVIKDSAGVVIELKCTYDPLTLGKNPEGRKVRAAIHWVPFNEALSAEIRLYERTFTVDEPGAEDDWRTVINPDALTVLKNSKLEPSLAEAIIGTSYQFERKGYFCVDSKNSSKNSLVFNRTIALRDSWAKMNKK
ncbi:MAG TPA: glutamine--tRNA ligase/YqeY domain fusion protein [Verrucomicrobia bacterium]|nr:glutamine--tRNA ligase/YqeY domain fusion protein [Verrucomicrobiales bacterium]HIL55004.1 glutamine--tRNA ligase/YqeY domain fusion protein [Verrucomicrobiota bacterium]